MNEKSHSHARRHPLRACRLTAAHTNELRHALAIGIALLATALATTAAAQTADDGDVAPTDDRKAAIAAAAPVTVSPPETGDSASWVEFAPEPDDSASKGDADPDIPLGLEGPFRVVARGAEVGIVRTSDAWFAISRTQGVLGRLAVSDETVWMGVDGQGRIFAASEQGWLKMAPDARAATREDGFRRLLELDGATHWDASPDAIVACSDDRVYVIRDVETRDVDRIVPSHDGATAGPCSEIFVRADGTVLVVADVDSGTVANELPGAEAQDTDARDQRDEDDIHTVWISPDYGTRWTHSSLEDTGIRASATLRRDGQWIWNGRTDAPVVLSEDRSWTTPESSSEGLALLRRSVSYDALVRFGPTPRGHAGGPEITLLAPAAPPAGDGVASTAPRAGKLAGGRRTQTAVPACSGAFCLSQADEEAPRSRYAFGFFSDGTCPRPDTDADAGGTDQAEEAGEADDDAEGAPNGADEDAAPGDAPPCTFDRMSRLPRLGVIDRVSGEVDFAALPDGCDVPLRVTDAAGLGILFCGTRAADAAREDAAAGESVEVFVRDPNRRQWAEEGTLPASLMRERLRVADDGTLLLSTCPALTGDCTAAIRRPVDPGTDAAWRELDTTALAGLSLLGAGEALLVRARRDDMYRFELALSSPELDAPKYLVGPVSLGDAKLLDVELDDDCVRVRVERAETGRQWAVVGEQGNLLDYAACAPAREEHARLQRQGVVRVTCNIDEARVALEGPSADGAFLDCPVELAVEPGKYVVLATAEDVDGYRTEIEVPEAGDVTVEAELFTLPFVDVRAYGGVTLGSGDTLPSVFSEIVFPIGSQYEVGPFFRFGASPFEDRGHGYLGGVSGRILWHFGDFDIGGGGGMGFGNFLGKEDGESDDVFSALTLRFLVDVVAAYRVGPVTLRALVNLYPSDPALVEMVGGIGVGF